MEPSVEKFSSKLWLKDENGLKDTDDIQVVFVLKNNKASLKKFEEKLLDISSPRSVNYGKWLKVIILIVVFYIKFTFFFCLKSDEIISAISPSMSDLKIVTDFIASFGLKGRVTKFRDTIHVKMPVKTANKMLNTDFALFRSVVDPFVTLPRITKPYSLPQEVADVVSIVDDIMRFPSVRSSIRSPFDASTPTTNPHKGNDEFNSCSPECADYTTPAVLQTAYSFSSPVSVVAAGNSMAVAEFQNQYCESICLHPHTLIISSLSPYQTTRRTCLRSTTCVTPTPQWP
jgi:hypothetical protein